MFGYSMKICLPVCSTRLLATSAFLLATVFVVGCNKPTPVASTNEKVEEKAEAVTDSQSASPPNMQTTSVMPSKTNDAASPATQVNEMPAADVGPDLICKKFMDFLQAGKRINAENLLTRTALMTTSRAELKLEPMGGPNSTCEFSEVRYATTKQKLAQVDCTVVESVDGETMRMDMTWVVRKQAKGWRISGVMLELEPGQVKDFLSFENQLDVQRMKMLAGSDVIEDSQSETRQAKAQADTIKK